MARSPRPQRRTSATPSKPHASAPIREAVLYARVSSKDQEREGFSIPAQQGLLRSYAAEHGFAVVEEFTDVETAKRAGRTHFGKMLAYLRKRPTCRVVLVEKTDRLYRNVKDWVTLDGMDLEIHLVKEGSVLSDESRSSEKFIHGIKVLMAKNYIDNLSEETKKGMLQKARQGIWPSRAPLGYRNVQRADGKRIIESDPEVAPLVQRIFEWYATGEYSLKTLTRKAKDAGMVFRKSRKPLPRTTIHTILQNPLYKGQFEWDGVLYDGIHEALVTRELWNRVQDVMHGRATNSRRTQKRDFAFSGLVSCGVCAAEGESRLLIGSLVKKKYIYYHCERCKQLKRVKHHREQVIDEAIVGSLRSLRLDDEVMDWLTTALRSSMQTQKADNSAAVARLQARYDKLQHRIDAAYEDRLDGRIDAAFFDRKARGWREDQAEVRRQMAAHEAADQGYMETGIALLELAQRLVVLYESQTGPEKRRLLKFVHSNSLWDGEELTVGWRQPFGILAESPIGPPTKTGPGDDSKTRFGKWLPVAASERPADVQVQQQPQIAGAAADVVGAPHLAIEHEAEAEGGLAAHEGAGREACRARAPRRAPDVERLGAHMHVVGEVAQQEEAPLGAGLPQRHAAALAHPADDGDAGPLRHLELAGELDQWEDEVDRGDGDGDPTVFVVGQRRGGEAQGGGGGDDAGQVHGNSPAVERRAYPARAGRRRPRLGPA